MKRAMILMIAALLISPTFAKAQTGNNDLLQQAQSRLQAGDFDLAIQIYDRILHEPIADPVVMASSRIDRAMAKPLLARSEAVKDYQQILQKYADEPAVTESANKQISRAAFLPGIYIAEFDSTTAGIHAPVTRVTTWDRSEQFPVWSPDGQSLAFTRNPGVESSAVVLHLATGKNKLQESQGAHLAPLFWSSDSETVFSLHNAEEELCGDPY